MEIHIDTKRDSDEEIRKAIRMLQAYVGQNVSDQNTEHGTEDSDSGISDVSPGAFNIFGEDSSESGGGSQNNDDSMKEPDTSEDKEDPKIQIVEW